MILYTPLSQADIFPTTSDEFSKRQCVSYQGKVLYVEEKEKGSYELLQLISTDPQDFLDNDFLPGNKIMG